MSEAELASEFTRCYPSLVEYASKALWKLHSPLELDDVLAECYLHCHSCRVLITPNNPLEGVAKNWIKSNLHWPTSPIKLKLIPKDISQDALVGIPSGTPSDSDPSAVIEEWYSTLTPYERRLWNLWYQQDLRRGKQIAGYLDISVSSGFQLLRECRELSERFRQWIHKNK
jgi:hypothetical protein